MKQIKAAIIQTLRYIPYTPLNWVRYLLCLDSMTPVSRLFGFDRGTSMDRYYIGQFIKKHASCIHENVLGIAGNTYTKNHVSLTHLTNKEALKATGFSYGIANYESPVLGSSSYAIPRILVRNWPLEVFAEKTKAFLP